jgi:hypothetical protein
MKRDARRYLEVLLNLGDAAIAFVDRRPHRDGERPACIPEANVVDNGGEVDLAGGSRYEQFGRPKIGQPRLGRSRVP